MIGFDELKNKLLNVPNENKSFPFWSWNSALDNDELIRQIDEMHSKNIGGFIMHARTGLITEYLGEDWFKAIEVCLKRARELGMEAWVYDENGWPSGFVGGKLLENVDFRARYLEYAVLDEFDESAFAVYKETEPLKYERIEKGEGNIKYHTVYLRISPANSDILNPDVTEAFIKETHEKYYERFKESFGRELKGFFTDEPQYYRWGTPYTGGLVKMFEDKGKNVKDGLVYLFVHSKHGYEFRTEYFNCMNYLYCHNFYEKLYKWCDERGCMLTGHSVEEPRLFTQMWGGADCASSYEYEHIPGVDFLGRSMPNEFAFRQVASVADQMGKKYIMTESFGCGGHDTTPKNLKACAEVQFFNGVNRMCHHLFPFSITSQGRVDHPPVFSRHSNWFEEFEIFNEHFNRLSYIISETKNMPDVAIINPMRSTYLDYIRNEDYESVKTLEEKWESLKKELRANGIKYDLIDEAVLARHGKANGDKLVVGECEYETIIVPYMPSIASTTYEILKEYTGKMYVEEKPEYVDGRKEEVALYSDITFGNIVDSVNVKFEQLEGSVNISRRSSEFGDFIFLINISEECSKCVLDGVSKEYSALNIDDLTLSDVKDEFVLEKHDSVILYKNKNAKTQEETNENITCLKDISVDSISKNYIVLDNVSYSFDGVNYTEKRNVQGVFEDILRKDYEGELYVRYEFVANDLFDATLVVEKEKYEYIKVNGNVVDFKKSNFDIYYLESDVSKFIIEGTNTIEYKIYFYEHDMVHFALFDPLATESVRNCLYYDTTLESFYLKGDFVVEKDMSISKVNSLPTVGCNLEKQGYPFFRGSVKYSTTFECQEIKKTSLELFGRCVAANVYVNGHKIDYLYDFKKDITEYLVPGKNDIEIVLKSSNRNLYGPHHHIAKEPWGVSPYSFTLRGSWNFGQAPEFDPEYNSVPFGLEKAHIIIEE